LLLSIESALDNIDAYYKALYKYIDTLPLGEDVDSLEVIGIGNSYNISYTCIKTFLQFNLVNFT